MAHTDSGHGFTSVRTEGTILPPSFLLDSVSTLRAKNQSGPDYGLTRSLSLRDEIARYWNIARDLFEEYEERKNRVLKSGRNMADKQWPIPLIRSVLRFEDLERTMPEYAGDRYFPLTHRACEGTVPMLLTSSKYELDRADASFGFEGRRQAPHSLMQEFLNVKDEYLWGVISNGSGLRLLRDNVNLTRPAFIEADLETMFREELYSDFAAFWLTAHESRLRPSDSGPSGCILEKWRQQAHKDGERALDRMREGVTEALLQFGNGFLQHPQNKHLRASLDSGALTPETYYEQLLRLVYRMLFLFTTEERDLLHVPNASDDMRRIYSEGYSVSRLRSRALKGRHYDHHEDLWSSLRILFTALQRGEPSVGLPGLGGLFSSGHCPDLDGAAIENKNLLEAVRHLGYFRHEQVLTRINYRDMGTEELGSVYESLLEYHPIIDIESIPWKFKFTGEGIARKLTGSYYTPSVLVNELIGSALDPVLSRAVKDRSDDPRKAILSLNVIDPSCGSGHFLLAAARRMASVLARLEAGGNSPDESVRRQALREVIQHCIYGVDRNPLAVQLCRTALWIEAVEPGRPLTFLDPHIQLGDSLIGILDPAIMKDGIPDHAFRPLLGDDAEICALLRKQNKRKGTSVQGDLFDKESLATMASDQAHISDLSEDTIVELEEKKSAWNNSLCKASHIREELRANLFVTAFFSEKTSNTAKDVPIREDMNRLSLGMNPRQDVGDQSESLANRYRLFHWHIRFAEVMSQGGFDVVLGNPPWERIKLQDKEFFAVRSPKITAAPNKAVRDRLIRALSHDDSPPGDKMLYREYIDAKRSAEAAGRFMRHSTRFPLTSYGDINTYSVFAETSLGLLNPNGRAGIIVPTGIATDNSAQRFFQGLIEEQRLASLFDFENREKLFRDVDSRMKFSLLTLANNIHRPSYLFFATNVEHVRSDQRRFELTREEIRLLKPNTRTAPTFRSKTDAEIIKRIYSRLPVLVDESRGEAVNPWGIQFTRMFDMSNDSEYFRRWQQLDALGARLKGGKWMDQEGNVWVPLVEAKMIHQFDHRWATFERDGEMSRLLAEEEKMDPEFVPMPRYWVPQREVSRRIEALMTGDGRRETGDGRRETGDGRRETGDGRRETGDQPLSIPHLDSPRRKGDGRSNSSQRSYTSHRIRKQRSDCLARGWSLSIRLVTNATNQRTAIMSLVSNVGIGNSCALAVLLDG